MEAVLQASIDLRTTPWRSTLYPNKLTRAWEGIGVAMAQPAIVARVDAIRDTDESFIDGESGRNKRWTLRPAPNAVT